MRLDDPSHGLVGGAADRGRTPIAPHIPVGGNHVHTFPRVLRWSPPAWRSGDWLAPPPSPRRAHRPTYDTTRRVGTSTWPQPGGPDLATSGDFLMATDTLGAGSVRRPRFGCGCHRAISLFRHSPAVSRRRSAPRRAGRRSQTALRANAPCVRLRALVRRALLRARCFGWNRGRGAVPGRASEAADSATGSPCARTCFRALTRNPSVDDGCWRSRFVGHRLGCLVDRGSYGWCRSCGCGHRREPATPSPIHRTNAGRRGGLRRTPTCARVACRRYGPTSQAAWR